MLGAMAILLLASGQASAAGLQGTNALHKAVRDSTAAANPIVKTHCGRRYDYRYGYRHQRRSCRYKRYRGYGQGYHRRKYKRYRHRKYGYDHRGGYKYRRNWW